MKINLRRMEVFKTVFEMGSVSAAARSLNVSQPSVSRLVKDFELDLGFKLFDLDKGKMRATPEAKRLFKEGEPVFAHIDHLARVVQQLQKGEEGTLIVAVSEFLAWDVFPRAALRFTDLYPHIRLSMLMQNTEDQLESLSNGQLDLAIGSFTVDVGVGVRQVDVGKGTFVAITPEGYELKEGEVIDSDSLENQRRFTALDGGPMMRDIMKLADLEVEASKSLLVGSPVLAVRLAEQDNSIFISDIFSAVGCRRRSSINPLPLGVTFGICAKHLDVRPLSNIQRIFLDIFREEIINFMDEHNIYSELVSLPVSLA